MANVQDPPELRELDAVLAIAIEHGPDVLSKWENEFVQSISTQRKRRGPYYELSDSQKETIEKIKAKLEREGVL